ncbi:MAG: hypothetical protein LLG44_09065 [Chloroflexi bacterium]|nr:hypothetical protein [Chloroflexota bacterium]
MADDAERLQARFPREWRIAPAVWPDDMLQQLEALVGALSRLQPSVPAEAAAPALDPRALGELCTQLWRLRSRMLEDGKPREEMRRVYRYVEMAWDTLAGAKIEILDHTGQRVPDTGFVTVKILAFEPHAGLLHDTVIETVKPSVYQQDKLIQAGEVIVGRPA